MKQILCYALLLLLLRFYATAAYEEDVHSHHHQCNHGHDHHHYDDVSMANSEENRRKLLPEELAELEDLKLYGFSDSDGHHHHHHEHNHQASELSGFGLWIHAMGCSLLVSLASLICLILLPLIFVQGKPSKALVDSLALFGAGAMLGDAFLHQLPHAFGGEHSHEHDTHADHSHDHTSHSHSLKDLSVGMSVLAGIVLFLLVEKLVRYVDNASGGSNTSSHGHSHSHSHKHYLKENINNETNENHDTNGSLEPKEESLDENSALVKQSDPPLLRKRKTRTESSEDKADIDTSSVDSVKEEAVKSSSNLVFGYLNLFSDGVHNFTDGMALGSAFLLYGSIGGWSRTVFLLAHELPQEIGDFGILVRSGFSVSKALFFNFLSALVALAGTALALMWGQDPGQSSLIEGFTAGGFIYIAVAGVLAEMNKESTNIKSTIIQLISLTSGMGVALCISLSE